MYICTTVFVSFEMYPIFNMSNPRESAQPCGGSASRGSAQPQRFCLTLGACIQGVCPTQGVCIQGGLPNPGGFASGGRFTQPWGVCIQGVCPNLGGSTSRGSASRVGWILHLGGLHPGGICPTRGICIQGGGVGQTPSPREENDTQV